MKLKLSYQTQHLPAPYAFSATFSVEISEVIHVALVLTYLDREDLSEEEILAEGYSLEDDFSWEGQLGANWIYPIKELVRKERTQEPLDSFYLHIAVDDEEWFPAVVDDVVVQDLLQAVFEAKKKEAPLTISFATSKYEQIDLTWKFAERTVYHKELALSWDEAHTLMRLIYSNEFEEMKAFKKPQVNSISFDGQVWFVVDAPDIWKQLKKLLQG